MKGPGALAADIIEKSYECGVRVRDGQGKLEMTPSDVVRSGSSYSW